MGDGKFEEDFWLVAPFDSLLSMEAFICGFAFHFGDTPHSLLKSHLNSAIGDLNCVAQNNLDSLEPTCCPTHAQMAGHTIGIGIIVPANAPTTAPLPHAI